MPDSPVTWTCRFHPTDWWHEVGCPHVEWTKEQLQSALESQKRSMNEITLPLIRDLYEQLAKAQKGEPVHVP